MTRRRLRLGVAGRLALLLSALATLSTGLALVLQARALDQDLRSAAQARLERSAATTDRLISDHLRDIADRYAAISRTPELRANLEAGHEPTLRYFAAQLLDGQSATMIAFVDPNAEPMAPAGDPRLVERARQRVLEAQNDSSAACVSAGEARARGSVGPPGSSDPAFEPCQYPEGGPQATLLSSGGDLFALVAVPLRTGTQLVGGLLAVEPIGASRLEAWSELSGAQIHLGAVPGSSDLVTRLRRAAVDLHVSTTYEAERRAIGRARRNLVVSGQIVLILSLVASYLLARGFARPIVQMREATERVSAGQLDQRLDLDRNDEIGELGRAFDDLVARLRRSQESLRRAQRLARFGNWQLDLASRTVTGTAEFRRLLGLDDDARLPWTALLERVHGDDRSGLDHAIRRAERRGGAFRIDVRARSRGGRE
ncbi:MAG: HAMP domain-containing protein, partial [Gemmatimonadota bacterium]